LIFLGQRSNKPGSDITAAHSPRCTAQHQEWSHRVAGRSPASRRGQREPPI